MLWIQDVRQCLMQKLKDSSAYENAATSPYACGDLRTEGFDSHPHCYVDHGFCSPSFFTRANLEGLWNVFDFGDFLSRAALSQVLYKNRVYNNLARVLIAVYLTTIRLGEPSHAVLKFIFNFKGFLN